MRLESLEINNFKNIKNLIIDEFKKTNLIIGETGNGKTALQEALGLIFVNHLSDTVSEYINWDDGVKFFDIRCIFYNNNNDKYDYYIKGQEKSYKRKLVINDSKEETYEGSNAVKKMAEIINPTLTLYSAISKQGKTSELLFEGGSEKLEKFKELFGISKLNLVGENIKVDSDKIDKDIERLKTEINVMGERVFDYEECEDLPEVDIENLKVQNNTIEKNKIIYAEEVIKKNQYDKDMLKWKDAETTISIIKTEKEDIEKSIIAKNIPIDIVEYNAQEYNDLAVKISELEKDQLKLNISWDAYNASQLSIKDTNTKIEDHKKIIEANAITRLSRLPFKPEDFELMKKDQIVAFGDFKIAESKYNSIFNGECPTCNTKWEGGDLQSVETLKNELFEKNKSLESDIARDTIILDNYNKGVQDNILRQNNINTSNKSIDDLNKTILELSQKEKPTGDLASIEGDLNLSNATLLLLNNTKIKYDDYVKKLETQKNEINELTNSLNIKDVEIKNLQSIIKPDVFEFTVSYNLEEHTLLKQKIENYNTLVMEKERIELSNIKLKKEEKENKLNIDKKKDTIDEKYKEERILKETRTVITKEFSAWLIDKGASFIKKEMNAFFQRSYNKYEITFEQDKNSIDFFYGMESKIRNVRMASGHEQNVLAIAFRKALCLMQPIGIMLLDEIDSQASDHMSGVLFNSLLEESEDQFLIVTHNTTTKELLINNYNAKVIEMVEGKVA